TCRETCFLFNCHVERSRDISGYRKLEIPRLRRNDRTPTLWGSNLNRPFENKFRGPRECDVAEAAINSFETDLKFVAAPREDSDWPFAILAGGEDERTGDYPRAARERFVFHAPFIGAYCDFVGPTFFDEVHVCPIR